MLVKICGVLGCAFGDIMELLSDKLEIVDNGYDRSINKYKKVKYGIVEYPSTNEILKELDKLETEITVRLAELRRML